MSVYQIKAHTNTYDVIDLDIIMLAKKLVKSSDYDEDTLIDLLMDLPIKNSSLKSIWPEEMECNYFGKSKEQNYDINVYTNFLVLKMNAYDILCEELSPLGEFLPLNVEGNKMMMFNLLTFAEEKKDLCEMAYLDGYENGLKMLSFNEVDIETKSIFKSKLQGGMANYCTDKFKVLVEAHNLTGIKFDIDLISPF